MTTKRIPSTRRVANVESRLALLEAKLNAIVAAASTTHDLQLVNDNVNALWERVDRLDERFDHLSAVITTLEEGVERRTNQLHALVEDLDIGANDRLTILEKDVDILRDRADVTVETDGRGGKSIDITLFPNAPPAERSLYSPEANAKVAEFKAAYPEPADAIDWLAREAYDRLVGEGAASPLWDRNALAADIAKRAAAMPVDPSWDRPPTKNLRAHLQPELLNHDDDYLVQVALCTAHNNAMKDNPELAKDFDRVSDRLNALDHHILSLHTVHIDYLLAVLSNFDTIEAEELTATLKQREPWPCYFHDDEEEKY